MIPNFLFHSAPYGMLVWQWLAFPVLVIVAWIIGRGLGRLTRAALVRIAHRTTVTWDDVLVERLAAPITLGWALIVCRIAVPFVRLSTSASASVARALHTALFAAFLFMVVRLVDVLATSVAASPWATTHPASRSLVPLGARTAKVAVIAIAVVALLADLGYPVASLVAGLGIGGLALALAAQKTVENVFGAFSIGLDQPFREGDFVKVEDFVGTVESIGLRSTRVRTLDRTLITIPNGRLADMRVESFAVRDRIRLATTISLVYSTSSAQMRDVLAQLEGVLRDHPMIWPDAVVVRFKELASSSLDIEVMAWFQTSDWGEFQRIRQDVLLSFMGAVERAGTSFAFPTRTLHLANPK